MWRRVTVFATPGLVRITSYAAHDLPVTGVDFAHRAITARTAEYDVLTSSPDNKRVTLLKSQGGHGG
jgi:hypothetical protein